MARSGLKSDDPIAPVSYRRRGQREERVLLNRNQRVDRCRVQQGVVFVSAEKESAFTPVIKRQPQRTAESKTRVVLFKRQAGQSSGFIVRRVRIENIVAEKVEQPSAITI